MNPDQAVQLESFVPVYDAVPESWEDGRQFLVEHLKRISNAINVREIGWFLDEEVLAGKLFIPSSANPTGEMQQFRTVLRKVVDTGQLPNATTKLVPHGITFDNNFTLVQIFGAATEPPPGTTAIPLPFVDVNPINNIQLYMDGVNVVIVTTSNQSRYTRSFVTIEYIQEL
jgi:hypothetical protein